eukprot:gnl/TRDRNA2_/TRDRNA2_191067_c0_seq1.p2 gnl/TRDRNA2_/TRDRNA2_191067_c0~~gnl/TRDRNA2_/TRDRNA2_191067_c0_seq1.p2  ORF type:complete len:123 (-),score=14.27 gnl/TRDRNA2_/TRDRNA2_191067_c0_seq1:154-522(-)
MTTMCFVLFLCMASVALSARHMASEEEKLQVESNDTVMSMDNLTTEEALNSENSDDTRPHYCCGCNAEPHAWNGDPPDVVIPLCTGPWGPTEACLSNHKACDGISRSKAFHQPEFRCFVCPD